MKYTINFGEAYANRYGVVKDLYSFVKSGSSSTSEAVGVVQTNKDGIGEVDFPRNSRYAIIFRGVSAMCYYAVGDPSTWKQRIQYAPPSKPYLSDMLMGTPDPPNWSVMLTWTYDNHVTYEVEMSPDYGANWSVVKTTTGAGGTTEVIITSTGNYTFRVRGKNSSNIYGKYSNEVEWSCENMPEDIPKEVNVPEPYDGDLQE